MQRALISVLTWQACSMIIAPGAVLAQSSGVDGYADSSNMMWWGENWYTVLPAFHYPRPRVADHHLDPGNGVAEPECGSRANGNPHERFARGEIDAEEFEMRRRVIAQ